MGSKLGSLGLSFQPPVVLFRDLFSFVSGRFFPRCTEGPEPISFSRVVISGSESTDSVGRRFREHYLSCLDCEIVLESDECIQDVDSGNAVRL